MRLIRNAVLLACSVIVMTSCAKLAPEIDSAQLPHFDAAYLCGADVGPWRPPPDSLSIADDCVPIDVGELRELVVHARPDKAAMWKGGSLIVASSESHGDRYFYASAYGDFFVRPDTHGCYVFDELFRSRWVHLIRMGEQALHARRQRGG